MRVICLYMMLVVMATAAVVDDFAAALVQAKSSKLPVVVMIHGSDWNKPGELVSQAWSAPAFVKSMQSAALMVAIDRKESPTADDLALAKRNESCGMPIRSLPAIGMFDADGRLVAVRSGMAEIQASGGMEATVKSMLRMLTERDALWKRAVGSAGQDKAVLLGNGLDRMNQGLGHKNCYQSVLDEIKKADPTDRSGYVGKYTFSSWALLGMVMDKAGKKEQPAAEQELAKWVKNTRLSSLQRQELHAARFALYQRWPEKKSSARGALEDMRKEDPKSELGMAAASYLKQLKDS